MKTPKYKYNILLIIGSENSDIKFTGGYWTNDDFKPHIDIASPDGKRWTFEFESRFDGREDTEFQPLGTSQLVYLYKERS